MKTIRIPVPRPCTVSVPDLTRSASRNLDALTTTETRRVFDMGLVMTNPHVIETGWVILSPCRR